MRRLERLRNSLHLSPENTRLALGLGVAALALAVFGGITFELIEDQWNFPIDKAILDTFAAARQPWMTGFMLDITALGSGTVVTMHTLIALVVLLLIRDGYAAVQLVLASVGAALQTYGLKAVWGRTRPSEVVHLVEVSGFSYPSGHSLASAAMYLTIAILVCRHLTTLKARMALMGMAALVVGLIGLSRMYLGVHYPSDVAGGISLGCAWALLLAGSFSVLTRKNAVTLPV